MFVADAKTGQYQKTGILLYPVKVPSLRTEQFEDLEVVFGAKFINKDKGAKIENIEESDLGFVEKLVVKDTENREDAIALGGRGSLEDRMKIANKDYQVSSPISERIKVLKSQIEEERIESHKKLLERRIASLGAAVGIIRVGASTSAEARPLKLKIEDAQYACKAALEEGYVKGGGLCLKEIADELEKEELTDAQRIMLDALRAPYDQIQENNGEPLEIGDDVIDPVKVVRLEVEHAVSVAANLITAKISIAEEMETPPGEGYTSIAHAIHEGVVWWARERGLITENQRAIEMDQERVFEQRIHDDEAS
jgi:chaperonin GroEL